MSCEDDYIHQQTNNNLRELRKKSTERRQASLLDTRYAYGINESLRPNRNDEKTEEARNRERGIIERTLNAMKSSEPSRVKMSQKQS